MRVLLTGASGYVGLHLARELYDHGDELTALVRSAEKLGPYAHAPGASVVLADLEDEARVASALEDHDVCVHAALLWGEPGTELEMRDTAVAAKLFDAAGRAGVSRCIYVSSVAVHRPFSREMSEDDRVGATDLYGATKAAGELVLRAACAEHGMTGIVVRPGPVVGAPAFPGASFRSDHRLEAMVGAGVEGRAIEVSEGEGRQLSDVAMVARVVRRLARVDDPHPTYLCLEREPHTWEAIARTVVAELGSGSEVRVLDREAREPIPRFRTDRVDSLLGGPCDADAALVEHVRHLAYLRDRR